MNDCPISNPCPLAVDPHALEVIGGQCPLCQKEFSQMADKFVSLGTPCTPHQHELLTILIEECGEVITRATKAKRFGLDETQPGQFDDNADRLGEEIGDVLVMISLVKRYCCVTDESIQVGLERKPRQLRKFMQTKTYDLENEATNG